MAGFSRRSIGSLVLYAARNIGAFSSLHGPQKLAVASLAALCCVLGGCANSHHEEHEGHAQGTFSATSPLFCDTVVQRDYVCQIHSIQHIEIRALEKGYLQDVLVDEGQLLQEGQLMFRIKPVLYQAEVQEAKAEMEFAEIEYRNTKALADSNVVSPNELSMAKARLDKARAELDVAQAHLGFTEIRAPFAGIMGHLHVRKGSLLDEGELLTELSDNSSMWVYFNVPEAEYLKYKEEDLAGQGTEVELLLANSRVFDQKGKITAVGSDFNNHTGNIAFRATFPNPQRLLRHGQTGNILINSRLDDVLLVPQKATFEILDHRYIYVIGPDSVLHSTPLETGAELQHLFQVRKGLRKDDLFLLEGLRKVKDGETVHYETIPVDSVVRNLALHAE